MAGGFALLSISQKSGSKRKNVRATLVGLFDFEGLSCGGS
jgi:hypothetical protein